MRRVVVTGLGAITPLGVGIRRTWSRLVAGESGLASVLTSEARWRELPSTVAGVVPRGPGEGAWEPSAWLSSAEQRRMSTFTQYAVAASEMALRDAGWHASCPEDQEATGVCLGSGIGNLDEIYETSLTHHQEASSPPPLITPVLSPSEHLLTRSLWFRDIERSHLYLFPRSSSTWLPATSR